MIAKRATYNNRSKNSIRRRKSDRISISGYRLFALIVLFFIILTIGSSAKLSGYTIAYSGEVMATAYNSMESQTDDSPWITASGTRCRKGVIASNFLPFGTKVRIEGFGNQIFVVEDRMNKRYHKRIDIWFSEYNDAVKFGIRKIKYHVLKTA